MYLFTIDPEDSLIHMAYVGHVNREETTRLRMEVEAVLPRLKPGFCVIADLSALDHMDLACAEEIRAMMEKLKHFGVSRVIRVIPDHRKDIGLALMSYFHYGHDVSFQTVESLSAALKLLEA
jgi:hypothetical protein